MKPGAYGDTHAHVAKQRLAWTTRPGWRARRSLVLGGLVCAAVVSTRWVRLNLSPSVPRGLYRLTAVRAPLARGTLVMLPVPASMQPWRPWLVPLLKPVAAVAGDWVCVRDAHVWVHGQDYGLQHAQAAGQWLPQWRGCRVLEEGEVFLASPAPKSLDSRYFGIVRITALTAQAIPVLTWRWPWSSTQTISRR